MNEKNILILKMAAHSSATNMVLRAGSELFHYYIITIKQLQQKLKFYINNKAASNSNGKYGLSDLVFMCKDCRFD